MSWKNKLLSLARSADDKIDEAIYEMRETLGLLRQKQILPYRSYGMPDKVFVRGRVLHQKPLTEIAKDDTTLENLLKPENKDQLVAVLTYHVVPGEVMKKGNTGSRMETKTVQGSPVVVDLSYAGPKVNEADIVTADIKADNGVIHVIDEVILPPM